MKRSVSRFGVSIVALAAVATAVFAAPAPGRAFVVVTPAGPKDVKTVAPYLNTFLGYLEAHEGVPTGTFNAYYYPSLAKGERALLAKKAGFAMLTLGLYLKHRDKLRMKVIAGLEIAGKRTTKWNVVSLSPDMAGRALSSLRGKRLAWSRFEDPVFASRVLLGGAGIGDHFVEVPVSQPVQAVRALLEGEADVALITEAETAAARKLPGAAGLTVVQTSMAVPLPPIVALQGVATPKDIKGIGAALHGMCADAKGKSVCEDFMISRFAPATAAEYAKVAAIYAGVP